MQRHWMRIYREQRTKGRNMQNARLTYKDVDRKEIVQELYCFWKSLANKQRLCSFSGDTKWAIYEFKLGKHWQKSCFCSTTSKFYTEKHFWRIELVN